MQGETNLVTNGNFTNQPAAPAAAFMQPQPNAAPAAGLGQVQMVPVQIANIPSGSTSQPQVVILQPHQVQFAGGVAAPAAGVVAPVGTGQVVTGQVVTGQAAGVVVQQQQQQQPAGQVVGDPNEFVHSCNGGCCNYSKHCCNVTVSVFFALAIAAAFGAWLKWEVSNYWAGSWPVEWSVITFVCIAVCLGLWFYFFRISPMDSDNICCWGSVNITFGSMVLCCGIFWLICTCFDADSIVWVRKENGYGYGNVGVNYSGYDDSYGIYDGGEVKEVKDYGEYQIVATKLRDVKVGDWLLSVDPSTKEVSFEGICL